MVLTVRATRVPTGISCEHAENMQTPERKASLWFECLTFCSDAMVVSDAGIRKKSSVQTTFPQQKRYESSNSSSHFMLTYNRTKGKENISLYLNGVFYCKKIKH